MFFRNCEVLSFVSTWSIAYSVLSSFFNIIYLGAEGGVLALLLLVVCCYGTVCLCSR